MCTLYDLAKLNLTNTCNNNLAITVIAANLILNFIKQIFDPYHYYGQVKM